MKDGSKLPYLLIQNTINLIDESEIKEDASNYLVYSFSKILIDIDCFKCLTIQIILIKIKIKINNIKKLIFIL